MAIPLRILTVYLAVALWVLLVPIPIQAEPDVAEAGSWAAYYDGVAYEVLDGTVKRIDGARPDPEAAREVLKAKRVHGLVSDRPDLVERLAEREVGPEGDLRLSYAHGAREKLAIVSQALAADSARSLLSDLSVLPVRPIDLVTDVSVVRSTLDAGLPAARHVGETSRVARGFIHAFDATHAVEDKTYVVESFLQAVPIYEAAAQNADVVRDRAALALGHAYALRDAIHLESLSYLDDVTGSHVESELVGAIADLEATVSASQAESEALRSDAAFMQAVATEAAGGLSPLVWVAIGSAGLVGAALTGYSMLRRRSGLP